MSAQDETVMRLLHYFITKKNYNPIILHGIQNEIWLENLNEEYRVIRIVSNHIHNNEQMNFDMFKTKRISKQIKGKTLTLSLNMLNIYTDLSENVNLAEYDNKGMKCIKVENTNDFKKYSEIAGIELLNVEADPKKGMDLFVKLSSDISKKTEKDAIESEKIFKLKKPTITYALIAINIIVFILMYILGNGPDGYTLIKFGANNSSLVKDYDEYYRLVSAIFLHASLIHLFFNMYALYIIGPQLESFYGKIKFLIIYLLGGIIGNLFANIFEANTIGVGASGAIFALFGALLYFGYHYRVYLGGVIKNQILPIIIFNLLLGFIYTGISSAAHIGGLIGGVILSMAVGVPNKSDNVEKTNGKIITLIVLGFLIWFSIFK